MTVLEHLSHDDNLSSSQNSKNSSTKFTYLPCESGEMLMSCLSHCSYWVFTSSTRHVNSHRLSMSLRNLALISRIRVQWVSDLFIKICPSSKLCFPFEVASIHLMIHLATHSSNTAFCIYHQLQSVGFWQPFVLTSRWLLQSHVVVCLGIILSETQTWRRNRGGW